MKKSLKSMTLKKMAISALFIFIIIISFTSYSYKRLTHSAMLDKGHSIATFVQAGLISHMQTSSHEKQRQYIHNLQNVSDIVDIKIIHSPQVTAQFALPSHQQYFKDPIIANVFKNKKPNYRFTSLGKNPNILRVTFPYIADYDKSIDCLLCHNVADGTVLGAVDFYIDMSPYNRMSSKYIYIMLTILVFSLLGVLIYMFRFIDDHIVDPMEELILNSKSAYENHHLINMDTIESIELQAIAQKMNLINAQVLTQAENLQAKSNELLLLNQEIEATRNEIINTVGNICGVLSTSTAYHMQRVSQYAYLLAKAYGLNDEECNLILSATPLYDIGKAGIPYNILYKPGALASDELAAIRQHPQLGYEMLKHSSHALLQTIATISHEHHEHWDGQGYPQGLKAEEIHIYARIVAIADVFDALISKRTYKNAWPIEDVITYFTNEKGRHFDPRLVDIFITIIDDIMKLKAKYDILESGDRTIKEHFESSEI